MCTDHCIIEILGLRPSNRLPVSYYGLATPGNMGFFIPGILIFKPAIIFVIMTTCVLDFLT